MNLADAIRQASQTPGEAPRFAQVPKMSDHTTPPLDLDSPLDSSFDAPTEAVVFELPQALESHNEETETADVSSLPSTSAPGLIKLELYLPPEQLQKLIRSVVASQHSVLTLREAASLLRITAAKLEEMSEQQLVPAFKVDGKWRFSRARLEEWTQEYQWEKEQIS